MLGCKGLMFRHLRMMHFVVVIWPKGILLLLFAVLRKIVSKVMRMLEFFCEQNTVDSGLTGELPVRSEIELQRFYFTFTLQHPTWFPGSPHIPRLHDEKGKGAGNDDAIHMRYCHYGKPISAWS